MIFTKQNKIVDYYIYFVYNICMNTNLIKSWVDENKPQGISKLSAMAEVSWITIEKILNRGHTPSLSTVKKIARAMNVTLEELFKETPAA